MAATEDLIWPKGAALTRPFQQTPVEDITGWTLVFTLRKTINDSVVVTKSCPVTNATQGQFALTLLEGDTSSLPAGVYIFNIWRTDVGAADMLVQGRFLLENSVPSTTGADLDPLAIGSLVDLKRFLGILQTEVKDDDALIPIGNGVSAYIEARTATKWKARDYTITRDGDGRSMLLRLPRPINSVASLVVDGTALTPGTDYFVYSDSGKIKLQGRCFTPGFQNVVVTLNAGYTTVPYDILEAFLELAKSAYDELKTGAVSLSSINIGSVNAVLKPGLNPRIEKFLDAQKDVRG